MLASACPNGNMYSFVSGNLTVKKQELCIFLTCLSFFVKIISDSKNFAYFYQTV